MYMLSEKNKGILLGVLLTIVSGVAINAITPIITGERQSLEFSRFETIPFKEDNGEIAIYHIVIRNNGITVLDEITAIVSFEDAIIEKWKLSISPAILHEEVDDSGALNIYVSSLNPKEFFSISLIASSHHTLPNVPEVSARSEGIIGEEVNMTFLETEKITVFPWYASIITIIILSATVLYYLFENKNE